MTLRLYISIIACISCTALSAQQKQLVIEGAAPNIYLSHTVIAKENIYSIGRMYNVSPKDQIAPFNNSTIDKPLALGQVIKIPLAANNFVQGTPAAEDEALIPVYHTVAEKEGMFRISTNYNKVPIDELKQWNNLKTDAVSKGTKLIVGYLKVKKELSPLAGGAVKVPVPVVEAPKEPVKPIVKTEPKKEPEIKTVVTEPVKKDPPVVKKADPVIPQDGRPDVSKFKGGAFKADYNDQVKNSEAGTENGAANVFKSTSGWNDGKYYCLYNSAQPGTIIKVTSSNGKVIYAKVLDSMPDIKQNTGLLIRISNAAAEELGVGENKFDCSLSYSK